jgi:hypothetical protein
MIGLVKVKASEVHIADLSVINGKFWMFKSDEHELEGLGYVCPSCGNTRIVKSDIIESVVIENKIVELSARS